MGHSIGRILFSATCAGAAVLAVGYPGWAAETQSQAYGGYVDLALQALDWPDPALAGSTISLPLRVTNLGPQPADIPQVVFSADASLRLSHTEGCVGSPTPSSQCVLGAPLAPGDSRELIFHGWLHPSARGQLTMGAFALSEAIDVQPGNEMAVAAVPIQAQVDLVARVLDPQPEVLPDGRLRWRFELNNAGPSDALGAWPSFYGYASSPIEQSCLPIDAHSACVGDQGGAIVAVGGGLRFEATAPPLSATNPDIVMTLHAVSQESETNYTDNLVSIYFLDQLFVDEFED